jgi:hypothetical protein
MRSERIVVKPTFEFILPLLGTYHLIYMRRGLYFCLPELEFFFTRSKHHNSSFFLHKKIANYSSNLPIFLVEIGRVR